MAKTVEWKGLKELDRKLRHFGPMIQGKKGYPQNPLRNAARAMTKPVIEAAKSRAPRNPLTEGDIPLAMGAELVPLKERDDALMKGDSLEAYNVGARKKQKGGVLGAYYVGFAELGSDTTPAKPFLRPALEASKYKALGAFAVKLRADVDKITRKLRAEK